MGRLEARMGRTKARDRRTVLYVGTQLALADNKQLSFLRLHLYARSSFLRSFSLSSRRS